MSSSVLDVNDVKTSRVSISLDDNSNSSNVRTRSDHDNVSVFELDEVDDLSSFKIDLDGIESLDQGVGESKRSVVVSVSVGNSSSGGLDMGDLGKLVLGLFSRDGLKDESTLGVIEKSEVFSGLLDGDDIHKSSGELRVSSNLSVDLDLSSHDDLGDFISSKGVLQSVSEENSEGDRFSPRVRSVRRSGSEDSAQLGEHPMLGSSKSL